MKVSTIILTLIFSSLVFSRTKLPQNLLELQEDSEDYVFVETTDSESGERLAYLGLQEGETTLYKTVLSPTPFLEWTALQKDGYKNFDLPVSELFVKEREELYVLDTKGEVWFSSTGGVLFVKTEMEFSKEKSFEEQILEFETNDNYFNSLTNSKKYTNQINNLPPMVPTVWDTILWDEEQILFTNVIPIGNLVYLHGQVAVDDSGNVHIASIKEDDLLRYHRSTDYGISFEPEVVLEDTMASAFEIISTGDNVYLYSGNSIFASDPKIILYSSFNKGDNWNVKKIDLIGSHIGLTARLDSLYEYQHVGQYAYQSKSYDGGINFGSYSVIGGPTYSDLQQPSVAIGGNSIVYVRTGSSSSSLGVSIFRSFDLGNTWLPELNLTTLGSTPDVSFSGTTFHINNGHPYLTYSKSTDYGNTFSPLLTVCQWDTMCAVDIFSQNSSYGSNEFVFFRDKQFWKGTGMRFSRDDGNNWSQLIRASTKDDNYTGTHNDVSIATDDSLVYVVYARAKQVGNDGHHQMNFRRGFYKYPYFSSKESLNLGVVDSSTTIDTTFTIQNKGVIPLVISQLDFPPEISTGLLQMPFTIPPDSSFEFQIYFTPQNSGTYTDTLKFYTNQQIGSLRKIIVNAEIPVGLEEENNLPVQFNLSQNYPNPFNPETIINYELPKDSKGKLTIFNILGEEVNSWQLNKNTSNYGKVVWDGTDRFEKPVSSGVYLYRLQVGNESLTKKMMLLR